MRRKVMEIVTAVMFSATGVALAAGTAAADPGWGRTAPEETAVVVVTTTEPTPTVPLADPGWG